MKSIILTVATTLLCSITLFSQTTFGLKGGLNYADVRFNSGIDDLDELAQETTDPKIG
ncbi:MAG: hypothetical protein AAGJ18_04180 [Bacteroidota bacterium]